MYSYRDVYSIQIADNKAEFPDYDRRHGNKAKNGWY